MNAAISENRRLFQNAINRAVAAWERDNLESTLAWSKIAAHFALARHPGVYMSPTLENLLLGVAQKITDEPPSISGEFYFKSPEKNFGKMRFVHVLTESYSTGGHSAFTVQWIKNTSANSVHSVIFTAQNSKLPGHLWDAIKESGGWYCCLPELSESLVEQALFLRLLSRNWADVIVLSVHPFDPLPTVAFGVDDGPPIILCNHADHVFWLGGSVADMVVDYHLSGSELAAKKRGIHSSKILPIPLTKKPSEQSPVDREELNLKDENVVLLTVGRKEKFLPYSKLDFLEVMAGFLQKHPNTVLVAVGPELDRRWKKASDSVEGRIHVLGVLEHSLLEKYYAVADVYVPSFPCGSGTALLEAGMAGLPIVGLHIEELPHISLQDDVAFKPFSVHVSSVEEFVELLEFAVNDLGCCRAVAGLVKENIMREHCSPGWNTYLNEVLQSLPSHHALQNLNNVTDETDDVDQYIAQSGAQIFSNELPEHTFSRLVRVYAKHLKKSEAIAAQAQNLLPSVFRLHGTQGAKACFCAFRDFLKSAV